jgi:hypothetical protein
LPACNTENGATQPKKLEIEPDVGAVQANPLKSMAQEPCLDQTTEFFDTSKKRRKELRVVQEPESSAKQLTLHCLATDRKINSINSEISDVANMECRKAKKFPDYRDPASEDDHLNDFISVSNSNSSPKATLQHKVLDPPSESPALMKNTTSQMGSVKSQIQRLQDPIQIVTISF